MVTIYITVYNSATEPLKVEKERPATDIRREIKMLAMELYENNLINTRLYYTLMRYSSNSDNDDLPASMDEFYGWINTRYEFSRNYGKLSANMLREAVNKYKEAKP